MTLTDTTVFRTPGAVACLLVAIHSVNANAAILIEDTNFAVSPSEFPTDTVAVEVAKLFDLDIIKADGINPPVDLTTVLLGVNDSEMEGFGQLVYGGQVLNAGSDWYIGEPNQLFSAASIANGTQERWGDDFESLATLDVPYNEDFWFGINTGEGFEEDNAGDLVPRRDIFGWIQLQVDTDLNVSLVDNAMAFDSGQIVIGRNLVPEPGANLWAFVAALGLLARQRRRRVGA